jgi:hypothetical protein
MYQPRQASGDEKLMTCRTLVPRQESVMTLYGRLKPPSLTVVPTFFRIL